MCEALCYVIQITTLGEIIYPLDRCSFPSRQ
jgi:hypothetical protein